MWSHEASIGGIGLGVEGGEREVTRECSVKSCAHELKARDKGGAGEYRVGSWMCRRGEESIEIHHRRAEARHRTSSWGSERDQSGQSLVAQCIVYLAAAAAAARRAAEQSRERAQY